MASVAFYLFANDAVMLDAYLSQMEAASVPPDSGGCDDEGAEGAYWTTTDDEDIFLDRFGCFVDADGFANVRITMSGAHVEVGILGRNADMEALVDFAWRGSPEEFPTLWSNYLPAFDDMPGSPEPEPRATRAPPLR